MSDETYNVLFVISDQHRRDITGCYGNGIIATPAIDSLATRGVLFDDAFCPSPLCLPSRSALITGQWPHTCGGVRHGQEAGIHDVPTMGSVFRDAGYAPAAFGKMHVPGESPERDFGFDDRALRIYTYDWQDYIDAIGADNVDRYATYRTGATCEQRNHYNPENVPVDLADDLMYDAMVVDLTEAFLREHRNDRFFAWVGLEKPHPQWYAPARFHALYDPADMPLPETLYDTLTDVPDTVNLLRSWVPPDTIGEAGVRGAIAAYYANVAYLDSQIARLLRNLDDLGLTENTIVVYTSDHGDNLFEHGLLQKHCFYEGSVRVPLIVAGPGLPQQQRRSQLASLIDLFPTLLDLNGLEQPAGLEGVSLGPAITRDAVVDRDAVFSEFYDGGPAERMIRTERWKYIHTEGDICQLYDLQSDPLERTNLIGDPQYAAVCRDLEARVLADWQIPDPA
jgi:choline-sulfatase